MNKLKVAVQLIQNMGIRYFIFRIYYAIKIKVGILKREFPVKPKEIDTISLSNWRSNLPIFFFYGKDIPGLRKQRSSILDNNFNLISKGNIIFFNKLVYSLGKDYDWNTNPETGFKYNINQHWTCIEELSKESGDIKFVWEKARFSFLYDIIRYDYHFEVDCSKLVFDEIISFIEKNPINQGPNYKCSQEISLRIFNWVFALYYYKDSEFLTETKFHKIINCIYWQIHHVYRNINFSRIAVRNNHAITETLLLYVSKFLFPFLPNTTEWSKKGKKWFEKEILYQIYNDGTYLQFSNNYHRVVIQLLTWGLRLSEINEDRLNPLVYEKARKSLDFLYQSMDTSSGFLPNYGSNDGALFFKLNSNDYKDYRPQLRALSEVLNIGGNEELEGEDKYWYGLSTPKYISQTISLRKGSISYPIGGYYLFRDNNSLTFIRCGNHNDRPAQADNLHLDIWFDGVNYFRDNGSYKYNTATEYLKFFMGTGSHNTIMLDNYDQMYKGQRFTWYYWSQAISVDIIEYEDKYEFTGVISAFGYLDKKVKHKRKVIKLKERPKWIVEDEIIGTEKYILNQLWHPNPEVERNIIINSKEISGNVLENQKKQSWYSSYYGIKEPSEVWKFSTNERKIITEIEIKK